jgi:integrase
MLTVKEIEALRERRAKLLARLEELGENGHTPVVRPKNPQRQRASKENRPKAPLTVKGIQKLKPKAKPYEVLDGDGLYVTVRPSGAMSFNLRYRFGGAPRNLTIGPVALGLAEARRLAAEARGEIARGNDPCAQKNERRAAAAAAEIARNAPVTDAVSAVAERFIAKHVRPKTRPASRRETERLLRVEILPPLGERRLGEISRADVRQLIEKIAERAPIVANRTLGLLRQLFNWAREEDIVGTSPCDGLKPPAAEKSRDRVLTYDEVRLFWKACEVVGWPFGPLAQMLLLTGQRRDEVGAATWAEINLETATWTLAGERVKNDRGHAVALSAPALRLLESLPRIDGERGFVFTTSGAAPVDGFSRAKNRIDAAMLEIARRDDPTAAEIPHWTFHDLRRTAASCMAALGVAPHVIEAVLNHASGTIRGVARVYNRFQYEAERRAALEAWGRQVELLATGETASNVVPLRTAKAE